MCVFVFSRFFSSGWLAFAQHANKKAGSLPLQLVAVKQSVTVCLTRRISADLAAEQAGGEDKFSMNIVLRRCVGAGVGGWWYAVAVGGSLAMMCML